MIVAIERFCASGSMLFAQKLLKNLWKPADIKDRELRCPEPSV